MEYLFSIIIPIYNSEKFIKYCINSIIEQKHNSTEIILINDFSKDQSKQICEKYKKKYPFISLINNKKNYGVGISRNLGIKKAKGKYIIFVDSDDCLYKDALINLEKTISKNSISDVIFVPFTKITYPTNNFALIKSNLKNNNSSRKFIKYLINSKFPFADCWMLAVNRKFLIFNNIFFSKIRFGESELFVVKILTIMKKYNCMQLPFYDKKDRDSSLNHSRDFNATLSLLILILDFCFFIKNYNLSKFKKDFISRYVQDALGIFSSLLILRNLREIALISKIMQKKRKYLYSLQKLPEKFYFKNYLKKFSARNGLVEYTNDVCKYHYNSLKSIFSDYKYFFCYCRSKYSESTIYLLKKYNINVMGIIDDNEKFINTKFLNFKTINSSIFIKRYSKILSKSAIIISHQKKSTSEKIVKSLIKKGISKKQIKIIKF